MSNRRSGTVGKSNGASNGSSPFDVSSSRFFAHDASAGKKRENDPIARKRREQELAKQRREQEDAAAVKSACSLLQRENFTAKRQLTRARSDVSEERRRATHMRRRRLAALSLVFGAVAQSRVPLLAGAASSESEHTESLPEQGRKLLLELQQCFVSALESSAPAQNVAAVLEEMQYTEERLRRIAGRMGPMDGAQAESEGECQLDAAALGRACSEVLQERQQKRESAQAEWERDAVPLEDLARSLSFTLASHGVVPDDGCDAGGEEVQRARDAEEIDALRNQVEELHHAAEEWRGRAEQLQRSHQEFEAAFDARAGSVGKLETVVLKLRSRVKSSEQALRAAEEERDKAIQRARKLQTECEQWRVRVRELEAERRVEEESLTQERAVLRERATRSQQEVTEVQRELGVWRGRAETRAAEVDRLQEELRREVQRGLSVQQQERARAGESAAVMQQRLQAAQQSVEILREARKEEQDARRRLEQELVEVVGQRDEIVGEKSQLTARVRELEGRLESSQLRQAEDDERHSREIREKMHLLQREQLRVQRLAAEHEERVRGEREKLSKMEAAAKMALKSAEDQKAEARAQQAALHAERMKLQHERAVQVERSRELEEARTDKESLWAREREVLEKEIALREREEQIAREHERAARDQEWLKQRSDADRLELQTVKAEMSRLKSELEQRERKRGERADKAKAETERMRIEMQAILDSTGMNEGADRLELSGSLLEMNRQLQERLVVLKRKNNERLAHLTTSSPTK